MFDIFYYGQQKPNIFPGLIQFASSLSDARAKSRTKYFWYIECEFDYKQFDFAGWFPSWSQLHHTHIHLLRSHAEGTKRLTFAPKVRGEVETYYEHEYIPKFTDLREYWTFPEDIVESSVDVDHWVPPQDDLPYIYHFGSEFQQSIGLIYSVPGATDIKFMGLPPKVEKDSDVVKEAEVFFIDMNNTGSATQFELIKARYPNAQSLRFMNGWVETITRCLAKATSTRFWVVSSENDYSEFNFNWHPSAWQTYMLHVFPANEQKFGDTFYVHGPSFKAQANNTDLSTWYNVNYCGDQRAKQLSPNVVTYSSELSAAEAIKSHKFTGTYTWFKHESITDPIPSFTTSSWAKKYRSVHVFSKSGSLLAVPRDSQLSIQTQVYDYPFIMHHEDLYVTDKLLDIVYISNGEPDAERWYEHLKSVVPSTQTIHWVKDINGRSAAYKECARVSTTPWYFNVFAKLEVNPSFEWDWQPDYMQQPKHYIFNALNPVNGLVYGHQACIAYNKKLVLETDDSHGLDFTLSKEHEVVNMLSGTAHFNVNPIITWRTAFREAIKLKAATDAESVQRLAVWCTKAEGLNAEWSLAGANDAVEYYNSVNGDMNKLILSFDWAWLNEYYANRNILV